MTGTTPHDSRKAAEEFTQGLSARDFPAHAPQASAADAIAAAVSAAVAAAKAEEDRAQAEWNQHVEEALSVAANVPFTPEATYDEADGFQPVPREWETIAPRGEWH